MGSVNRAPLSKIQAELVLRTRYHYGRYQAAIQKMKQNEAIGSSVELAQGHAPISRCDQYDAKRIDEQADRVALVLARECGTIPATYFTSANFFLHAEPHTTAGYLSWQAYKPEVAA